MDSTTLLKNHPLIEYAINKTGYSFDELLKLRVRADLENRQPGTWPIIGFKQGTSAGELGSI